MFSKFTLIQKYFRYYFTASNGKGHGIHSPFVFQFVQQVLNDKKRYYAYSQVEGLRKRMHRDAAIITVDDMGAGSSLTINNRRSISQIARTVLKPKKYAQLLFRMVNFYQPGRIIELGTSLGITTAYLASAKPDAKVVTIEGASAIADKAVQNFSRLGLSNIRLVRGSFEETLQLELAALGSVDLAFIDGNHRQLPTQQYFDQVLQYAHPGTILIFDDIHWSAEMEAAWEYIKAHPSTRCTIDLFFIGLVFFREEFRTPQHFIIRF